jgi:hypothetical protein
MTSGTEPGQRHLNGIQTSGLDFRNLSKPAYDVVFEKNVIVEARDGVRLMTDVYRPDADGLFPALLSVSCYPRQIQNVHAPIGIVEAGATDFFVPRGYVHVIANARGTSGSPGTWGLLDAQERDDLYDLVEWLAAQPWCDGNVGMLGINYFAMTQIAAAVVRPPSLKAIFPVGTSPSPYQMVWHHGLLNSGFFAPWISAVGVLSQKKDRFWRSKRMDLVSKVFENPRLHQRLADVNGEKTVRVLKNTLRSNYPEEPFGRLWRQAAVEHPTYDAFWAERDSTAALANVDIPVYLAAGWDNVSTHLAGTFSTWSALARNPNAYLTLLPSGGLNWPWESLHYEALAWYDHWLKDADTGITERPRVRYFLPGADEWRTADQWPPAESAIVEYALRADGTLRPDVGGIGSRSYLRMAEESGRPRNANTSHLPDRLHWHTPLMTEALELAGNIELRLEATITALDTAWIAVLYDIGPDGRTTLVSAGWLRAMLRDVDERDSMPGAPVVPCHHPSAVPVGEPVTYRIPLVPAARRIEAGHQLRLTLTSGDDGKGAPTVLGFRHAPLGGSSLNSVHTGSRLLLPVVPASPDRR